MLDGLLHLDCTMVTNEKGLRDQLMWQSLFPQDFFFILEVHMDNTYYEILSKRVEKQFICYKYNIYTHNNHN